MNFNQIKIVDSSQRINEIMDEKGIKQGDDEFIKVLCRTIMEDDELYDKGYKRCNYCKVYVKNMSNHNKSKKHLKNWNDQINPK